MMISMNNLVKLLLVLGLVWAGRAKPLANNYATGYGYYVNPLLTSQFHTQDELGQYSYSYNNVNSAKSEVKTADGVVRGSYSYVDANGLPHIVHYVSDAFGFRVAATNLPVAAGGQTVPVYAPTYAHQLVVPLQEAPTVASPVPVLAVPAAEPAQINADSEPVADQVQINADSVPVADQGQLHPDSALDATFQEPAFVGITPDESDQGNVGLVSTPLADSVPAIADAVPADGTDNLDELAYLDIRTDGSDASKVPVQVLPETNQAAIVPVAPVGSQYYNIQDDGSQYEFGYSVPQGNRVESKTADGVVTGKYNYVDSNGAIQTVNYIADQFGFRADGTNIPIAIAALPEPVEDTPEVAAAKAEHFKLLATTDINKQEQKPVLLVPGPVGVIGPYDSQNLGHYAYGYATDHSFKQEQKGPDGIVTGVYGYIDANGQQQRVDYISDAFGFRVAATNLPVHTFPVAQQPVLNTIVPYGPQQYGPILISPVQPEVVATPEGPVKVVSGVSDGADEPATLDDEPASIPALPELVDPNQNAALAPLSDEEAEAKYDDIELDVRSGLYDETARSEGGRRILIPYAGQFGYGFPELVAAPVTLLASPAAMHHHTQDELGQYSYGFSTADSAKNEIRTADGVVKGSYSYIDANGIPQTTNYISDALGFRVAATNLPLAHEQNPGQVV